MAHSSVLTGFLSCYIVVRYAHAPKRDHTPNIRTLNFNFLLAQKEGKQHEQDSANST